MSNTPIPISERWPDDSELPVWWMVRSDNPEFKGGEEATPTHWQACTKDMNPKPLPYSPKAVDAEIEDGLATLSPAAQAVIDAVCNTTEPDCDTQHLIAAVLRAAVEKCKYIDDYGNALLIADEIEAIATELENAS